MMFHSKAVLMIQMIRGKRNHSTSFAPVHPIIAFKRNTLDAFVNSAYRIKVNIELSKLKNGGSVGNSD